MLTDLALGQDYLEEIETFDKISCQLPPFAILTQFYENIPETLKCDREDSVLKRCFYVIEFELHQVIDIIFIDGNTFRRYFIYIMQFKGDLT